MSNIIVNATAARSSGALSILLQFIENIPIENQDIYYVFVDPCFERVNRSNVKYITVNTRKWITRIKWEEYGLNKWIHSKSDIFDLFISFQNTGAKIDVNIPQLIYYHQSLALEKYKWSFFDNKECVLFMYSRFYSFFVKRYLTFNSYIVVQIPSIKKSFAEKFEFDLNRIYVIRPTIKNLKECNVDTRLFNDDRTHFIYPATFLPYKNHKCLIQALIKIKYAFPDILDCIRIHFTFNKEILDAKLINDIKKNNLENNFLFEGAMCFDKLLSFYKSSQALLFPSYIETFGLPLVEAASFGLPVIVTDVPYARDVIGDYKGSSFLPLNDIQKWAEAIVQVCINKLRFTPYMPVQEDGWNDFFRLINKLKSR